MALELSLKTLAELSAEVAKPTYPRSALSAGILHIGVGNFHRAHQAMYLHKLFDLGLDHDWAICGAGVTPYDRSMRERLQSQNWLTTVVEREGEHARATVCASMIDYCEVDPQAEIKAMTDPRIRIVSLTITEGGYFLDAETGGFMAGDSRIAADARTPDSPETVFGILIAALMKRRHKGVPPFTVMSCDNLPGNGAVARQTVLGLAALRGDGAEDWIAGNVAFPNSMVDCITPSTGDQEKALVLDSFGIRDAAPVVCEPFHQWVLEDDFPQGRPALEKAGVEFVEDVASYELMKLRILNGGHAALAYPAGLLDIHFVHDAMRDPLLAAYLDRLEHEEIIPGLPEIPGVDFDKYYQKIVQRFSNEAIGDTIPRLCQDGFSRQPKFILPVVEARLSAGLPVTGLALVSALWCRYCHGVTDSGKEIPPADQQWDRLKKQAALAREEPRVWLQMTDVYGSLAQSERFAQAFTDALHRLRDGGTRSALEYYLSDSAA